MKNTPRCTSNPTIQLNPNQTRNKKKNDNNLKKKNTNTTFFFFFSKSGSFDFTHGIHNSMDTLKMKKAMKLIKFKEKNVTHSIFSSELNIDQDCTTLNKDVQKVIKFSNLNNLISKVLLRAH